VAGVAATQAAIRRSDDVAGPGTGAVALGALPFARDAPGVLVVPRVVIGRRDGEAWITTTAGPGVARQVDVTANRPFITSDVLSRLRR
jgi:hypothetical protein